MTSTPDSIVRPEDEENWPKVQEYLDQVMELSNAADWDGALVVSKEAMEVFPNNPEPYFLLAILGYYLRDEGQAIRMAEKAHEIDPDTRDYAEMLATVSAKVGRLTDAVYYGKLAEACEPHSYLANIIPAELKDLQAAFDRVGPSRHGVEGQRFFNELNFEAAMQEFKAEISLNPGNVDALIFMARTALVLGSHARAIGAAQSAIHYEPDNALARALLARGLVLSGRDEEAAVVAREAIAMSEGDAEVYFPAMWALQMCASADVDDLKKIAGAFEEEFVEENEVDEVSPLGDPNRQRRIGMLSNAFYRTPDMEYAAGWFTVPPTDRVQIRGLQFSIIRDAVTTICRNGSTEWRHIYGIDPFTLSYTLRGEELDVLVDLSRVDGETCGTVAGLRPSAKRVGVTALPEPGLMPGITHVLSDETLASADKAVLMPGQEVAAIPGTLFSRVPFKTLPQDSTAPIHDSDGPTFATMARVPELSPQTALNIARVLRAVPKSRLLLFGGLSQSEQARNRIRECFMHSGVIDRVFFVHADESDEVDETLQRLEVSITGKQWAEVDVFLDTYPINGRREICEALWSGVPVVTQRGLRRASSVGASIVNAAGHPEWIAQTDDDFVSIATKLVADADGLADIRNTLQERIAKTPVFDPARAARDVRRVLLEIAG